MQILCETLWTAEWWVFPRQKAGRPDAIRACQGNVHNYFGKVGAKLEFSDKDLPGWGDKTSGTNLKTEELRHKAVCFCQRQQVGVLRRLPIVSICEPGFKGDGEF